MAPRTLTEILENATYGRVELKVTPYGSCYDIVFSEKEKSSNSRFWVDFDNVHEIYDNEMFKSGKYGNVKTDNIFEIALSIIARRYLKKVGVTFPNDGELTPHDEVIKRFYKEVNIREKATNIQGRDFLEQYRNKLKDFILNVKESTFMQIVFFQRMYEYRGLQIFKVDENTL